MKLRRRYQPRRSRESQKKKLIFGLLIIITILLLFLFVHGDYGLYQYWKLHREKNKLLANIERLKQEQMKLKKEIELLSTNDRYIEKIAREKYKMAKKGERIFYVIPSEKQK